MCGILVSGHIQQESDEKSKAFHELCVALESANASRGPDAQDAQTLSFGKIPATLVDIYRHLNVKFYASELRLRGELATVQPHALGRDVFCWNGEIFEGLDVAPGENDGTKLFEALCSLSTPEQIRDLLSGIEGPYAFVFHHEISRRLYFARDPLGRRSLLLHRPTQASPYFLLSSVGSGHRVDQNFIEVSTEHIYLLDLESLAVTSDIVEGWDEAFTAMPRTPGTGDDFHHFACPNRLNTTIPPHDIPPLPSLDRVPSEFSQIVNIFIQHLDKSVLLRVRDIPQGSLREHQARVAVLFSGGIDSTLLTYLAHRHVPPTEPIDLLNVAFENPRKIRAQREENTGGVSHRHNNEKEKFQQADGTFEFSEKSPYMVPDRLTGLTELEELRRLCPGRVFNFVEVNVPYEECQASRQIVETLMAPGKTVMDLSLALALYFASGGRGQIRPYSNAEPIPYTSPARVLLNGFGADELLGGYSRHRTVFGSGGWEAVITELQQEIDRVPARNLGRDDRVISSHGKETRHPFLSIGLVNFIAKLPVHFKMDPRLPPGFGDKLLLRLATRRLGLVEASDRKKRAMQFGSHSARMGGERRGDVELGHVMG